MFYLDEKRAVRVKKMKEIARNISENVKKIDEMSKHIFKCFFVVGVGVLMLAVVFYPFKAAELGDFIKLNFLSKELAHMGLTFVTEGALAAIISDVAIKQT